MNLLSPKEFAEMRGVTVQALAAERHKGTGPKFVKLGSRVFYRPEDIDAWINSNIYERTDKRASA
ncbi:helix-turn-helix transcriptional regulator [Dietzia cinnamea]|uniref:helix-turn-helix transcriptional regulator n=1 Tax=Dietzia cinnamea TaxID=321318 RepID=UPI000773BB1D|nr:helix-turn-helix domain-containing protein [Dietzia cinnamea]